MKGRVIPVIGTERDHDPDVDERLDAQPGRDPGGQQRPERVGRRERDPDALVGEDDEQDDDEPAPDEPELLADDREDEVVAGVRQEQPAGAPALAQAEPEEARPSRARAGPGPSGSRCPSGSAHGSIQARIRSSW